MLLTIIAFILILGLLVLFHELGHFLTAKFFGVKAEEFGFGYAPRIFGIYKNNAGKIKIGWGKKINPNDVASTIYSLNLIPVGGFVKIKGENGDEKDSQDSFGSKKIYQRAIMLIAGVTMNVVLCALLLSIGFSFGIPTAVDDASTSQAKKITDQKIQIVSVTKNSPADRAGLAVGDVIISINTLPIKSVEFLQTFTSENADRLMDLTVLRNNQSLDFQLAPEVISTSNNKAVLGVGLVKTAIISYPWHIAIWHGLKATTNLLISMAGALFDLLKNIFVHGEVTAELAGPVGIVVLTGKFVNLGLVYLLQFTAILSLNLAIINILPIPALDGGRLLFLLIEKIRRKEMNQKLEALIHNIGFALLMVLIIAVTYQDLSRWGSKIIEKIF